MIDDFLIAQAQVALAWWHDERLTIGHTISEEVFDAMENMTSVSNWELDQLTKYIDDETSDDIQREARRVLTEMSWS